MGCTDEGPFGLGLSEFGAGGDVVDCDVVMNFPFFDDLAGFEVEVEEGVGCVRILEDHCGVLHVEHHLGEEVSNYRVAS